MSKFIIIDDSVVIRRDSIVCIRKSTETNYKTCSEDPAYEIHIAGAQVIQKFICSSVEMRDKVFNDIIEAIND